jgi:hypothetical protein
LELGIIAGGLIAGHYAVVPIVPAGISEESIVGAYWNYSAIFGVNLISFLIAFVFSAYQIIATKKREF